MASPPKRFPRSGCPIATTLDILGDRWTLVIVRDLLTGKKRFAKFLESPERITTSILSDRLSLMEELGLIEKGPYQQNPIRFDYKLTKKGLGLLPVLQEICQWANRFFPNTWRPPQSFMRRKIK